jgi:hypothetical protein
MLEGDGSGGALRLRQTGLTAFDHRLAAAGAQRACNFNDARQDYGRGCSRSIRSISRSISRSSRSSRSSSGRRLDRFWRWMQHRSESVTYIRLCLICDSTTGPRRTRSGGARSCERGLDVKNVTSACTR